jgi:hypothetical protein
MTPRIEKLETLLARIKANAGRPRTAYEREPSTLTVPPSPDAQAALAAEEHREGPTTDPEPKVEQKPREREIEAPLESRARLVAAPAAEVEEIDADDVMELDDRHVVQEVVVEERIELAQTVEAKGLEPEEPPPSSRRPITEPAQTPQEAEIQVAHTPPPESGKQVAASDLSFDDDFTGVRETTTKVELPKPAPEESIQLQSLRSPAVPTPAVPDELEADLPEPEPADEPTRPPPGPLPPEVTRPTRPVAASQVAEMVSRVPTATPRTFGELLDLALSL